MILPLNNSYEETVRGHDIFDVDHSEGAMFSMEKEYLIVSDYVIL